MPPKSGAHSSSVSQLAQLLRTRLASEMPYVLFLGSRASAFARDGSQLADLIKGYDPSPIQLNSMQDLQRFSRAYAVLDALEQMGYSQQDLHAILEQARGSVQPSPADHSLSYLIKLGYFDTVITTNVDNLLDMCLDEANLNEGTDYAMFIRKRDDIATSLVKPLRRPGCQVIKLFGDFLSNRYIIPNRWVDLDGDSEMKKFLEPLLAQDMIIVGLDSTWEDGFDRILPLSGGSLWYVNDDRPQEFSQNLVKALKNRNGKFIMGPEGNYNNFFRALQWQIFPGMPPNYEVTQQLTQEVNRLRKEVADVDHKVDQIIDMLSEIPTRRGDKP